jgi:hypothetical protein
MAYLDDWGTIPQFKNIVGYGGNSLDFPQNTSGVTSMGAPEAAGFSYAAPVSMGGGGAASAYEPGWFDKAFGWTDTTSGIKHMGAAGPIMGGLSSLMNGWMGMQQLDFAKKSLAQQKKQFDLNYGAQRTLANTAMEDRQRARVASNSGAYESLDAYMAKNKVV